jgi:hypothetical protein
VQKIRPLVLGLVAAVALAAAAAGATAAVGSARLSITPASIVVAKGETFAIRVVQDAPVATSGAQASIDFDPTILQVVSVQRGAAYAASPVFVPSDIAADIRSANTSGHLAQVAAAWTPPDAVPPGPADFLLVEFMATGCGASDLRLPSTGPFNAQMISGVSGAYGTEVKVGTDSSHVVTCVGADKVTSSAGQAPSSAAAGGTPIAAVVGGAAGLVALALLGGLTVRARRRVQPDEFVD